MLIVAATFVLCTAIVLGMYWGFVLLPEQQAAGALRRRLSTRIEERPARTDLTKKEAPLSALKAFDIVLARTGILTQPLKRTVLLSGLPITIGVVLLACVFAAIVVFFAVNTATSAPYLAGALALAISPLPYFYVRRRAGKRLAKLEEQLPQAVDMIAVSLRAGHAFTTGLLMVAEELENPLGGEFRILYDQQNYGQPVGDVLREFADRVPLLDAKIFVTAVMTQRETGGNLAEVLDRLSSVIRERFRVRRQVKSLSAHGRITGVVLTCLPPVLGVILFVVAPKHMGVLFSDPFGRQLVAAAIGLQIVGTLAIRRIIKVEF